MKKLIVPIIIVVVVIALYFHNKSVKFDRANPPANIPAETTTGASGNFARVSSNTVVVTDQLPVDKVFVNTVFNENPGFVIIQKDASAKPGNIIGVSKWLLAGDNSRLEILASENLIDGMPYYATLYTDDGNGIFDPKDDHATISVGSKDPIMTRFMVDKKATDPRKVQVNF